MKKILLLVFGLVLIASCGDDDNVGQSTPPRNLVDQAPVDNDSLISFLQTHFYEVTDSLNGRFEVTIDTLAGDNADRTPLWDLVESQTINVSSSQLSSLNTGEEDVPHIFYYVVLREGTGQSPTVADSTLVRYSGQLLDGTAFDASPSYLWQELPFMLRGYSNGLTKLKSGSNLVDNGDGTSYYADSGVGLFFIPSGLAYYNSPPAGNIIELYDNLIFQIELGVFVEDTDSDNDGIPSILEDLNGNNYLFDDNTDETDERNAFSTLFPNFRDIDDDQDGVSTLTEISDADGNIIIPYPDSNNDGTPDYLDVNIQWDQGGSN